MLTIDILTLFPSMFSGPFDQSIIKRAQKEGAVKINIHNLRNWAIDKHGTVDDRPYGGGRGMILRPEPIFNAVTELKRSAPPGEKVTTILLTPQGRVFNQREAARLAQQKHLILICGHYEGVDERVGEYLVDKELSIGDYVLTGGEIPAMVVTDATIRLLPNVLEEEAVAEESFGGASGCASREDRNRNLLDYLEYPQYTRPEVFRGHEVPAILLSGNHEKIRKWREEKALERTKRRRPDLLAITRNGR